MIVLGTEPIQGLVLLTYNNKLAPISRNPLILHLQLVAATNSPSRLYAFHVYLFRIDIFTIHLIHSHFTLSTHNPTRVSTSLCPRVPSPSCFAV